jgi:hypothetical protein
MRGEHRALIAGAALAALCAGCGGDTGAPVTGGPTAQPTPPRSRSSVLGEVVAVNGSTATVEGPDGTDSHFTVDGSTMITQLVSDDVSDLAVGTCAFATGQRDIRGYVVGVRVVITAHGPTGCTRPGAPLGAGGRTAGGRGSGSGGGLTVAGGEVSAVTGMLYTVTGTSGQDHFTAGPTTPVSRYVDATLQAVTTGVCVVARGPAAGMGPVQARTVSIVPAAVNGCFPSGTSGAGSASLQ